MNRSQNGAELESYRVTTKVNSYKYNQPDSIEPVE